MNNKVTILKIDNRNKVTGETYAVVATNHISEYYRSWYSSIYNGDVTPTPPDPIVPSIAALYDEPSNAVTNTDRRKRGVLKGWAALHYDFGNPIQRIQGSRVYNEYKTEFLDNGYVKHTYVFKFNPSQCNGKINKLRVYGNPSSQCNLENVNEKMNYELMTKVRPYMFNSCHTGILMPMKASAFGVGETKLNMDWNPSNETYRLARNSLTMGEQDMLSFDSINGQEVQFVKRDLRSNNVSNIMPMPYKAKGKWALNGTLTEAANTFAYQLSDRGYLYVATKGADPALYLGESNSNPRLKKIGTLVSPSPEYNAHHSGQFNIFIEERDLYTVFRTSEGGDYRTVIVKYNLENLRLMSYKVYPSWPWWDEVKYRINDFFILPDGNFAVSTIAYDEDRNRSQASGYIVYDNRVPLDANTKPEDCSWMASLKTSKSNTHSVDPLAPSVIYGQTPDLYYGNAQNPISINGAPAETMRYSTDRKAFTMFNKYGNIGWAPIHYCGPEMILAEINIPEFIKNETKQLKVIFEFSMRVTNRTKPA